MQIASLHALQIASLMLLPTALLALCMHGLHQVETNSTTFRQRRPQSETMKSSRVTRHRWDKGLKDVKETQETQFAIPRQHDKTFGAVLLAARQAFSKALRL